MLINTPQAPTSLQEATQATELIRRSAHPEAQIIWGLALDDAYGDEIRVTVIAAGFDSKGESRRRPPPQPTPRRTRAPKIRRSSR